MDNFKTIQTLLSEEMGISPEKITMESRLVEDLNVDSIVMMVVIESIQEMTNADISDEDIKNTKTVADIVEFLNRNS